MKQQHLIYRPGQVSIADATLASSQPKSCCKKSGMMFCFNRRRDACFLATLAVSVAGEAHRAFQSQTRRLLPRNLPSSGCMRSRGLGFNRRRDACFLATHRTCFPKPYAIWFQSQTRRLLPRNRRGLQHLYRLDEVSIADATLASSQPYLSPAAEIPAQSFNRRRDACFLATRSWARFAAH